MFYVWNTHCDWRGAMQVAATGCPDASRGPMREGEDRKQTGTRRKTNDALGDLGDRKARERER